MFYLKLVCLLTDVTFKIIQQSFTSAMYISSDTCRFHDKPMNAMNFIVQTAYSVRRIFRQATYV